MPVEITGTLANSLDGIVRHVLHNILDLRSHHFVIHISQPHTEVVVHIKEPFESRLKFNAITEEGIARELPVTVTAIVDEELGPAIRA